MAALKNGEWWGHGRATELGETQKETGRPQAEFEQRASRRQHWAASCRDSRGEQRGWQLEIQGRAQ